MRVVLAVEQVDRVPAALMGALVEPKLRVISLGAGVQSTTMALMAARGDLPMPDCAIFADTQWEPAAVYSHLDWLEAQLPFPVHRVTAGDLRSDALARRNPHGGAFGVVPWHVVMRGKKSLGRRQCTKDYKLRPLQRRIVDLMGGKRPRAGAEVWVGISTDEAFRVRPSRVQYILNRHPLIELRFSRQDCLRWLEERQYPRPPKSSCIGCPFRDTSSWQALTASELADAVVVDRAIRHQVAGREQYVHSSGRPLELVDLSTPEERGQLNLFLNECEGMCGV